MEVLRVVKKSVLWMPYVVEDAHDNLREQVRACSKHVTRFQMSTVNIMASGILEDAPCVFLAGVLEDAPCVFLAGVLEDAPCVFLAGVLEDAPCVFLAAA